ncbi:MAG: phosphodiester glycosidase family protein [Verrucomicrobia bacterium]|nr:phosphodiester glycosidase family protein [Verrucomicrobiota bacterium]
MAFVAFAAFSQRAAGSDMAFWRVAARSDESDPSGAVRYRQLQAQGPDGQTAEIWVAFGLIGQVRCQVIAQSIHPFESVRAAVEQSGSMAGVNGGFFKADGSPVGLLVCEGRQLHPFEKARLLSGTFLIRAGRPYIHRVTGMPAGPLDGAIQCGPLLVERGTAVTGLNDERVAPRTFVFLTGRGKVGIGIIRSTTLAQAARLLISPALLRDDRINIALNLDGGSSTGFFGRTRGGSLDQPEWARVADCLVFSPKTTNFR